MREETRVYDKGKINVQSVLIKRFVKHFKCAMTTCIKNMANNDQLYFDVGIIHHLIQGSTHTNLESSGQHFLLGAGVEPSMHPCLTHIYT